MRRAQACALVTLLIVAAPCARPAAAGGTDAPQQSPAPARALVSAPKTVLILHSYHPGYPWTDDLNSGLQAELRDSPYDVEVRVEYMDTKRYGDAAHLEELAAHYERKYRGVTFDLVFTTDDAALGFVAEFHQRLFRGAPVVFCGVNDEGLARRVPRQSMTGVVEIFDEAGVLDLARQLIPGRQRIYVVTDNSTVGRSSHEQLRNLAARRPELAVTFLDGREMPFETILMTLRTAGTDSLVITSAFTRDRDGRYLPRGEGHARVAAASAGPVFSPSVSALGQGIVGGGASTGLHHAGVAAGIGRRILAGADPASLPIVFDRENRYVFDDRELTRWRVDRRRLPAGSTIINLPDGFLARYGRLVWGVLLFAVFQTAVIGALVANTLRRRRMEERLRQQTETLRAVNRELEAANTSLQAEIAERWRAESEKVELHAQLTQSQKMEAIGQLAGGIAHDFNNLLSVILGYLDFALEATPEGDPRRQDLVEVKSAGERAATLTQQLLAFSRKQVLQPSLLNLNDVTAGMESMLRRIIGEDVQLVHRGDRDLGVTLADDGQIQQVLLNLAVNARDAMPSGGTLTIETANVELDEDTARRSGAPGAGPYVRLSVSDTGRGMDAQTRARVFEPFFTTKERGKGTGLGLSMVYGIVKQSGGGIWVTSEPELGARFDIYLPRETTGPAPVLQHLLPEVGLRGTETVLVAEDEAAVRGMVARVLTDAGYTVLTASNGAEALRLWQVNQGQVHLVLTDVIMPGIGGTELAARVEQQRPGTRVLYMSGYANQTIAEHGLLDSDVRFLGKPFSRTDLLRKVREALDSGAPHRARAGADPAAADW